MPDTVLLLAMLQVWMTAVASDNGRTGTISSNIQSNAGDAKGKLVIEHVHVLGTPGLASGQNYIVTVNGQQVKADQITATSGVLKVAGLHATIGEALDISWKAAAASS